MFPVCRICLEWVPHNDSSHQPHSLQAQLRQNGDERVSIMKINAHFVRATGFL
jgi:hypothetical protein